MIAALLLAGAPLPELRWEADATVHAGGRTIAIQSRTTVSGDGRVVSESWPVSEGEAKGLRRMTITASDGWLERGGQRTALPPEMAAEERRQYGFYRELQEAERWCRAKKSGVQVFGNTSFRCRAGEIARAANWMGKLRQDFRINGLWRSNSAVFPRRMTLLRDGQPYFDMEVRRFSAAVP